MAIIKGGVLKKVNDSEIINGEYMIPERITSIGGEAFKNCYSLKKITIPKGVTSIGESAFRSCIGLQEIIMEGVTSIGGSAFKNCNHLENVKISEGVTSIGEKTFCYCNNLREIMIPKSVTSIKANAFRSCESLQEITIPEGVTSIDKGTFFGCSSLQEIKIPEGVTSIGEGSFMACESLKEVTIPEGVTSIEDRTFSYCVNLLTIKIPEGVTRIGDSAFSKCESLQEITIPEKVIRIGKAAFSRCKNLKNITIPKGVKSIGLEALQSCTNLQEVKIPKTLNDTSLENIYRDGVKFDLKLMFGDDLERFEKIKSRANFNLSPNYDETEMDIFYHRMIKSIGIEEVERIVEIPDLTGEEIKRYMLEKDENFKTLYETKYKIQGDLGVTLDIFKYLNTGKYKNNSNEKNNAEMKIFKEINKLLEAGEKGTLSEIIIRSIKQAGYEIQDIGEIEELENRMNGHLIKANLEKVEQEIEGSLAEVNPEQGESIVKAQIEPVRIMIEDVITKMFKEKGEIDKEELRERIGIKIDGAESPYIRQNRESIVKRVMGVLENKEIMQTLNHSALDAMRNTKEQIGGAWKYKINKALKSIGYTIDDLPENLTEEQIQQIEQMLNLGKEEPEIHVQTTRRAVLKEGQDRELAYKLLQEKGVPKIVTYQQIHDMFGPVHEPYSEEFKEFFKKHREEFLYNPEYTFEFGRICNQFDTIINSTELRNIYQKGELTLDNILGYLNSKQFANQREGDEELARLSVSVGQITTEEEFAHAQKIFDILKRRERSSIPPVQVRGTKYRGRMLSPDDILNMFAGDITTCCQRFGDIGEGAMSLGSIEENAGIFVIEEIGEDGKTNIVGQSLVIRQKGKDGANDRLCFDNIEIANTALEKMSIEDHAEILEIYKQAGRKAIEKDKKFLGKLLKNGKITQEVYDRLVLKEVVAGQGYNDLKGLRDLPEAEVVVPDEAYYNYDTQRGEKIHPWIDSAGGKAPLGSSETPVTLATMDTKDLQEIESRQKNEYPKVKLSDVPLWYGKVGKIQHFSNETLKQNQIETIKQIEKQAYREEQQLLNTEEVQNAEDIEYSYGIENAQITIGSNNDWYLVYGEDEEKITISDLAVVGATNADNKSTKENEIKGNVKLATAEAADTLYGLLINAGKDGKTIYCNATKDTSLINIKRILSKGLVKTFNQDGKEIIYDVQKGLVYANDGTEVEYRDFSSEGNIQMLDLIIEPNVEKLIQEKEKISMLLEKTKELISMRGKEKEEGLDKLRRTIREDLKDDGR